MPTCIARGASGPLFGALLGFGLWSGCLTPQPRSCADDSECVLEGRSGRCEATSYCSYGNSDCAARRSYGPYAGGGLAGRCLGPDDATGSTSGSSGTTGASSVGTSSSSVGGESSEPSTVATLTESSGCVDTCDDPAAEILGQWDVSANVNLAAAAGGGLSVFATGAFQDGGLFAAELVAPDEVRWIADPSVVVAATASSIVPDSGGGAWVAGNRGADERRPFAANLDANGELAASRSWSTLADDELVGMGVSADGGVVVGGRLWGRSWVEGIDTDGATQWVGQWEAASDALDPARLHVGTGGLTVIFGTRQAQTEFAMRTVNSAGLSVFDKALELDGEGLVATTMGTAGFGVITGPPADPRVSLVNYDAEVVWTAEAELASVGAVAIDGGNQVLVVGGASGVEAALFDRNGARRWTAQVDERTPTGLAALPGLNGDWIVLASLDAQTSVFGWRIAG